MALVSGCAVDSPTALRFQSEPTEARASGNVSVSASDPTYARQGDVQVKVRVFGSGFARGAKANWSLNGDTTQVTTISTTYISATEVEAVITVSPTAALDLYDIAVTNPDGKKGVGVELFAITTAQPLSGEALDGNAVVLGMNDLAQVVGYAAGGSGFVFDGSHYTLRGVGAQVWGVDATGAVLAGVTPVSKTGSRAAVWNRTGSTRWSSCRFRRTGAVASPASSRCNRTVT